MGIERKSLSMSEKDRLATAIHEAGHAVTCYFNKNAQTIQNAYRVKKAKKTLSALKEEAKRKEPISNSVIDFLEDSDSESDTKYRNKSRNKKETKNKR